MQTLRGLSVKVKALAKDAWQWLSDQIKSAWPRFKRFIGNRRVVLKNWIKRQWLRLKAFGRWLIGIRPRDIKRWARHTWQYLRHTPPKQILEDTLDLLTLISSRIWQALTGTNTRRVFSSIFAMGLVIFGFFHLVLANPARLYGLYEQNYLNLSAVNRQFSALKQGFPLPTSQSEFTQLQRDIYSASAAVAGATVNEPRQLYLNYALRNLPTAQDTLELLPGNQLKQALADLSAGLDEYSKLMYRSGLVIYPQDTSSAGIQSAAESAMERTSEYRVLDTVEIEELFGAIKAEAELAQATSNELRFAANYADLRAELLNQLEIQWQLLQQKTGPAVSENLSDTERLVFFMVNQLKFEEPELESLEGS